MSEPGSFFDRQEKARALTVRLVLFYLLGACALTLLPYAVLVWLSSETAAPAGNAYATYPIEAINWWQPELFGWTFGITLLCVLGATLFKWTELSVQPARMAESLGGSLVDEAPADEAVRRLRNVTQEMCLAAGLPTPALYVLDAEDGINAFAMGTKDGAGIVGVTRGALEQLPRAELQAVIAHELGHIRNKDTHLNVRLIALTFGLFALTVVGRILLYSGGRHRGGGDRKNGGAPIALFGLILLLCGVIGIIFGQLMQAAVSRQREHLADADATQFTRNPMALANALKRIGGYQRHGHIKDPNAMESAHLFFAPAVSSLFATHPPIETRIRALDPTWDGRFISPENSL